MTMESSKSKIHAHNTLIEFETSRLVLPFSLQEQQDIYLTSLADMIGMLT